MLNRLVLLTGAEASVSAGTALPEVLPGPQVGAARPLTPHIQGTYTHITCC